MTILISSLPAQLDISQVLGILQGIDKLIRYGAAGSRRLGRCLPILSTSLAGKTLDICPTTTDKDSDRLSVNDRHALVSCLMLARALSGAMTDDAA